VWEAIPCRPEISRNFFNVLLRQPRRILERLPNVLGLKIWIGVQDLLPRHVVGHEIDYERHGDARVPDAGPPITFGSKVMRSRSVMSRNWLLVAELGKRTSGLSDSPNPA